MGGGSLIINLSSNLSTCYPQWYLYNSLSNSFITSVEAFRNDKYIIILNMDCVTKLASTNVIRFKIMIASTEYIYSFMSFNKGLHQFRLTGHLSL